MIFDCRLSAWHRELVGLNGRKWSVSNEPAMQTAIDNLLQ